MSCTWSPTTASDRVPADARAGVRGAGPRRTGRRSACPADRRRPARRYPAATAAHVFGGHLLLTLRRDGAPLLAITDLDGGNVPGGARGVRRPGSIRVEHAEDYDARLGHHRRGVADRAAGLVRARPGHRASAGCSSASEVPGYDPAGYRDRAAAARSPRTGPAIPVTLAYRAGTPLDGTRAVPAVRLRRLRVVRGSRSSSVEPARRCSTAASSTRSRTSAAAARAAGPGGSRAGCAPSRPRSATSSTVADWLAGDAPGRAPSSTAAGSCPAGCRRAGCCRARSTRRGPSRWRAVVAEVPFVDCVTTMLDPSHPADHQRVGRVGRPA